MEIIPAIDIIDGKCVRLEQGDYTKKTIYNNSPVDVAKQFEFAGIRRIHLVDLDGAKAGVVQNWKVLELIASKTQLIIDFGGGIKHETDLKIVFNSGASFATIGSLAVNDSVTFVEWLEMYGANKFFLGADVKEEMIAIGGWLETTHFHVLDFMKSYIEKGVEHIFCTDISKDGKLEGPSIVLYQKIINQFPKLHFVASGGVSCMDDIYSLNEIGCSGAIVGKAIYEGKISIKDLSKFNQLYK